MKRDVPLFLCGLALLLALAGWSLGWFGKQSEPKPSDWASAHPLGLGARLVAARLAEGSGHYHVLLRVYVKGREIPVPLGLGKSAEVGEATIHRHSGDPRVHFEGVLPGRITLGQVMQVWGVPFSSKQLGPYQAENGADIRLLVKPKGGAWQPSSAFERLVMRDGQTVVIYAGPSSLSPKKSGE